MAEHETHEDFTEDGGLTYPAGDRPGELRGCDDQREEKKKLERV